MKAVVLHEVGGPLTLEEVPEPTDAAVLDVRAAGINFLDILIRRGLYPQMPELPHVFGSEVAGELDGRRVLALTRGSGGYADRVAVDPEWTFPLPDNASFAAGASFLMTYLTAYIPLHRQVRVKPGTTVLVHAGSGGVGCAAIQLAKLLGATVIATASSDEKRAFARQVGADEVARLRRDRRSASRRRARSGRWRGVHQLAVAAEPARRDRRDRLRRRALEPIRACNGSSAETRPSSASISVA